MPIELLNNLFGLMSANGAQPDTFLSHLLNLSDTGIFAYAHDGRMLMVNPVWEEALGTPRQEILGRHFIDLVGEEASAQLTGRTRRILQNGEPQTIELALDSPSGRHWYRINLFPVRNSDGEITVIGGIATEITAYRETQETPSEAAAHGLLTDTTETVRLREEVKRSSELLNAILISTSDAIYVKDREGRFLLINPPAANLLRVTPQEALGKRDSDFLPPEIAAALEHNDQRVMGDEVAIVIEEPIPMPDGVHTFLSTKDPMRDANGTVVGLVGFSQDITTRKQVESALQTSETRLQIALEAGQLGAWQWDIGTDALNVSEIFRQAYDFETDVPLMMQSKIGRIPSEERLAVRAALARSLADHADYQTEHRVLWRNGAVRWIAVRGRPFYGEDGQPTHMIGTSQDITDRKVREAELNALNILLKRAMQETHHRIKNNLQVIAALSDMQAAESDGKVPAEALQRIGQHTRILADLHDLLTVQAAHGTEEEGMEAHKILAKLVPMLELTSGGRQIRYKADNILLSLRQSASFAMLVSELISNAIKHGTGLIEVTLHFAPAPEAIAAFAPLTYARLEVCDDGAGFPADFDPQKAAHTGLELIESTGQWDLHGIVTFTNRPEGGACVVVVFPQETV